MRQTSSTPPRPNPLNPPARPTTTVAGLGLSLLLLGACVPDGEINTAEDGSPNPQVTIGGNDPGSTESNGADADNSGEDPDTEASASPTETGEASPADDETTTTIPSEEETSQPGDGGGSGTPPNPGQGHALFDGLHAVESQYPGGIVFEVEAEDNTHEFKVYDGNSIYEVITDNHSLEILSSEYDDTPDSDERAKLEAIDISFAEALQIAAQNSGSSDLIMADEAQLDSEDGVVVWEVELTNGREVYIDVTSGNVVKIDD